MVVVEILDADFTGDLSVIAALVLAQVNEEQNGNEPERVLPFAFR